MKKLSVICVLLFAFIVSGCASSTELEELSTKLSQANTQIDTYEAEIKKLKGENEKLTKTIDELENGADRLLKQAEQAFNAKDAAKLETTVKKLKEVHNGSDEQIAADQMLAELNAAIEKEEEDKRKAEEAALLAEKKRKEAALANLRKEYDEVREMSFYYDSSTTQYVNRNSIHLYIGKSEKLGNSWLNFKIQYTGEDWVFVDSYIIKTDNNSYTIRPEYYEISRDNDYGEVWEYYDTNATEDTIEMVRDIISSNKTIVRHQGDEKHFDYIVTSNEKKALQNILDAFDIINE